MSVLTPAAVDYTSKDLEALEARLFALVQSVFPTWTDHDRADFGNVLIGLFSHATSVLTKYQDNQSREAFIAWCTQRRNMLNHGKVVSFDARTAAAATVDVTFSIPAIVAGDVVIPAGTTVRTKEVTDPVIFQLLAALTIPAGSLSAVGSVENSTPQTDSITSDGTPNQKFVLTASPYLDDSASAEFGADTYTEVDDFLESTSSSLHFTLQVDANDLATPTFGNGINGKLPPAGAGEVNYKTGGGADGNVDAGTIEKIDGTFTDSFGTAVVVSVTNLLAASGGEDRMSVESMRQLIPASVRAQTRCIAREDFEIAALLIPGVGRALMLTPVEDVGIPVNHGWLFIVPSGGGTPSTVLKAAVLVAVTVTRPGPTSFAVSVCDPQYLTVNIACRVWFRSSVAPATGAAAIRANLALWFAPNEADGTPNTEVDFGYYLKNEDGDPSYILAFSDIFDVVKDTTGVLRMGTAAADFTLNGVHDNLAITLAQFPKLGTVSITDGATGAAL